MNISIEINRIGNQVELNLYNCFKISSPIFRIRYLDLVMRNIEYDY